MVDLQNHIAPEHPVSLVTITTDPEFDTPAVLTKYAHRHGADTARWHFLTGSKEAIRKLATASLKLAAEEKTEGHTSANDLFIHSTVLALVDKQGRLRAAFSSNTLPDSEHHRPWETETRPSLLRAVDRLLREPFTPSHSTKSQAHQP